MDGFRKACRWIHREIGYLAAGLTLVYAISGVAVNHAHHWNPNYRQGVETFRIEPVGDGPTEQIRGLVLERLALDEPVKNVWRAKPDLLQVFVEGATLDVDLIGGEVVRRGFVRRPLLSRLNFMHLNTGKGFWTWTADIFAVALALLAISGIFLVRGRRGLAGRGGLMLAVGIALPLVYLLLVGSP